MQATMKRVSFATTQTAYCNPQQLSVEELKSLCWYSEDELVPSRNDAREAMQMLQNGTGVVRLVPADVCIRGIEKYADAMAKVTGQRRLVRSVLEQQKKCPAEGLANISRYLSQPFKDLARYFANRSLEEEQQEEDEYLSASPVVAATSSSSCGSDPVQSKLLEEEDTPDDRSDTTEIPSTTVATSTKRPLSFAEESSTVQQHSRNVKQRICCSE